HLKYKTEIEELKNTINFLRKEAKSQTQGPYADNGDLRIVLLGKTGVGKSATGNTILGRKKTFRELLSPRSVTSVCQKKSAEVRGRQISVIDTPGLFDTGVSNEEIMKEIAKCITMAAPGPHVFLLVLSLGRFTQEEEEAVKIIQKRFGDESRRYTMVLFTRGDDLEGMEMSIDDFIKDSERSLQNLLHQCGKRYHVFNNRNPNYHSQVTALLEQIDSMVAGNGGSCYTNEMFQQAEEVLQEEQERILKEREQKLEREKEELKMKHEAEIKKMKRTMEEEKQKLEEEKRKKEKEFQEKEAQIKKETNEKFRKEKERELQKQQEAFKKEMEERDRAHEKQMKKNLEDQQEEYEREKERRRREAESEARKQAEKEVFGTVVLGPKTADQWYLVLSFLDQRLRTNGWLVMWEVSAVVEERYSSGEEAVSMTCCAGFDGPQSSTRGECLEEEVSRISAGADPPPPLVNIQGMDIERVDSYKYLGVHLNNKLDWSVNTTALHKGQSRLYLLRRLRSCGVQGALLRTFFHTVVASAIFYGVVCRGSSISTADRKRLDKLLKRAGSVLGSPLDPVQVVGDRRMLAKLASMLENDSHPMHETLAALGSSFSDRLLHPECVEERYRRSFLPAAVRLYNQHLDSSPEMRDLRVVLLGKTGVGKSTTGNTILGRKAFKEVFSSRSVTSVCQRESAEVRGRQISVIDTPGLFDTGVPNEEIRKEIAKCITMAAPGPHVFLLVLSLARFTQEEEEAVKMIQDLFGNESRRYTMVLFTRGDDLQGRSIEDFIKDSGRSLQNIIHQCGNRYHVFNNSLNDRSKMKMKIDSMVAGNGGIPDLPL
ncbi:hypothetical protein NFI96_029045, partial [Prochilodus magdalenae]